MANIPTHIAPPIGLQLLDDQQVYWCVESVLRESADSEFFIVRLRYGKTPECDEGWRVLAPSEYAALARERGFKVLAPDIAHPVPKPAADTA